jgi:hypothetical protein
VTSARRAGCWRISHLTDATEVSRVESALTGRCEAFAWSAAMPQVPRCRRVPALVASMGIGLGVRADKQRILGRRPGSLKMAVTRWGSCAASRHTRRVEAGPDRAARPSQDGGRAGPVAHRGGKNRAAKYAWTTVGRTRRAGSPASFLVAANRPRTGYSKHCTGYSKRCTGARWLPPRPRNGRGRVPARRRARADRRTRIRRPGSCPVRPGRASGVGSAQRPVSACGRG